MSTQKKRKIIISSSSFGERLLQAVMDDNTDVAKKLLLSLQLQRDNHNNDNGNKKKKKKKNATTTTITATSNDDDYDYDNNIINYKDKQGRTALHFAILRENYSITKLLLDHHANINCSDKTNRRTPLHLASSRGNTDLVLLLLEYNNNNDDKGPECRIDVNVQDEYGWTPLHTAIYHAIPHTMYYWKQLDIIQLLLDYGANWNIKTHDDNDEKQQQKPIDLASSRTSREIAEKIYNKRIELQNQFYTWLLYTKHWKKKERKKVK